MASSSEAAAADVSRVTPKQRNAMQNWEMFALYIPKHLWDEFKLSTNMISDLDLLLTFLINLGMRTPSETTQSMLGAVLILREENAWQEGMPVEGTFNCKILNEACASNGNPPMTMYPLGLHGDGVPVQGRMNQSTLDFWSMNLPCSPAFSAMRIPICCLDTGWVKNLPNHS